MFIGVQFKNRNKEFTGKVYDFELHKDEDIPKEGDIVRLMDEDFIYVFNGTRVKIVEVKAKLATPEEVGVVRYIESSMDE